MIRFPALGVVLTLAGAAAADTPRLPVIPILVGASEKSAQVSVTVDRGLRSSKRLRTSALRVARAAMQNGEEISIEHLRALAEARDGLAAMRYVRVLEKQGGASASDIAYFSAIAVGTGRVWTLRPMIEAMRRLDPATEPKDRINTYIRVLYPHAWAGNSLALEALVLFNGQGRLFGPLSKATRDRILAQAKILADGRIELRLAMGILETQRSTGAPDATQIAQARTYLEAATGSDHLDVRTTAQNLLRMIDNT